MKVKRNPGATHSFRLTPKACWVLEQPPFFSYEGRPYPRTLGGKSKLVSNAIIWCYSDEDSEHPSYHELQKRVAFWVQRAEDLENPEKPALVGGWRGRIIKWLSRGQS